MLLEKAVLRRPGLSKASIEATKALGKAAKKVQATLAPIAGLEKARSAAIVQRDAQAQAWETAFAALKRGAKAAEDDGAKGLFATLFARKAPKAKSPRAKKAPAAPGSGSAPA